MVCVLKHLYCSEQLSMSNMEKRYRNKIIIIIIICSDKLPCCHSEIEVEDQTFYLTRSQHTDPGPTSPSADPVTLGAWQGSHWSASL